MTRLVIDASVAVKWLLDEVGSLEARALLSDGSTLIAPAFVCLEIHHSLMFAARGGRCPLDVARQLDESAPRVFASLFASETLYADAIRLSWDLPHPVYDCLYIALSLREKATLITADTRQFAAARKAKVTARQI